MKGKHIEFLRDRSKMSQPRMAEILNVSTRTIAKWESESENIISPVYSTAIQTSLENLILAPIIRNCAEKIFETVPSELVAIWFVRYSFFPIHYAREDLDITLSHANWELILHENTARYQCLCIGEEERGKCHWKAFCNEKYCLHNDKIHKNMQQKSLTTFPLRSGKIISLAGDDISRHLYKRIPGRKNPHYHDQFCHSLLHVPYHIPYVSGPRPVALFSLQNKLTEHKGGKWHVMPFPEGTEGTAYTEDDERRVKNIIEKLYDQDLKEIIDAFDYLPDSQ